MLAKRTCTTLLLLSTITLTVAHAVAGQTRVTTPQEQFGHEIGADYALPGYAQLQEYWVRLSAESDRMVLDTIGFTEEGRPQLMAILTSPENHRNLDRYREIARRLALARGVSEQEARALAREGKAVVWIDGGLHATEVLGAQQLMELVYQMVSRTDEETLRFLDDIILLAVHDNPDGHDLVANWYTREPDPLRRSTRGIPLLYHKYAGHDNNRDSYMVNLKETENLSRVAYREWFPQIIYNHHQTGPEGAIMFAPPFRDPPNHNLDPLIITSLEQIGSAMHARFVQEGKGGTTMRSGASYSTWWNGGVRTTPYFHNMIGLLTETSGNPTPIEIPFIPGRQLPSNDLPLPVHPGVWHFRQSIDYSLTANRAVLDYASRNREHLLFNIWKMGTNSIERGSRDSWTVRPTWITEAAESASERGGTEAFERFLRDPAKRDARGYVIPADQPDFLTATKFVNALLKTGVEVHRATEAFEVAGKQYPAGSYVVLTAQAFRPHVLDMFEPQDHPDDFAYPGGPPIPPYDNTGWTLAFQMDVRFDRILDSFEGPFEEIGWRAEVPAGAVVGRPEAAAYLLRRDAKDAALAVNRLLAEGEQVHWMLEEFTADGQAWPAGTFVISSGPSASSAVSELAVEVGLTFHGVGATPSGRALRLVAPRIALADQYGGSMPSGWTRFILENFGFPYELVFPPDLDRGNLAEQYDVLILPDGIYRSPRTGERSRGMDEPEERRESVPEEFRGRVGSVTAETTIPQIMEFLQEGGTVLAVGSSTALAEQAGLGVASHLVDADGNPLRPEEFFVPGSILDVKVDGSAPVAHGLGERAYVVFSRSPVFRLESSSGDLRPIAWFDTAEPLRSGWAWGEHYLESGVAVAQASVGEGTLFLFGPRITFRSQPHGTFPFLFNGIFLGAAEEVEVR